MTNTMMMDRTGMGMPGMGMPGMSPTTMGTPDRHADGPNMLDGAALHHEDGKVHRRHEDHLHLRRPDGLQHDAEPLHDAPGRHVLVLLHDERHDGLLLQPDHGHVQVRDDQGRLLRSPAPPATTECCKMIQACCDCMATHDGRRLHLLRDDEQHPGLLRNASDKGRPIVADESDRGRNSGR